MSYKILNAGRERTPVTFSRVDAIMASNFLRDRKEAGMPVPSKDQVKRAERLVQGNPLLRGRYGNPLGIQLLALELPTTRSERHSAGTSLKPRRVRTNDQAEVTAPTANVQAFLDRNPGITLADAVQAICAMAGYPVQSLPIVIQRLDRFGDSGSHRVCGHLRDKARMLDAIAQAKFLIEARDADAAEQETAQ